MGQRRKTNPLDPRSFADGPEAILFGQVQLILIPLPCGYLFLNRSGPIIFQLMNGQHLRRAIHERSPEKSSGIVRVLCSWRKEPLSRAQPAEPKGSVDRKLTEFRYLSNRLVLLPC
jgi:hypothetical protein